MLATYVGKINWVDVIWGPSFAVTLTVCVLQMKAINAPQFILMTLIYLWALRLALHLVPRALHHGEDQRYTAMRDGRTPRFFVLWSLVAIFGLQVLISLSLSTPFLYAMSSQMRPSVATYAMLGLSLFGLLYETIADRQLNAFLAQRQDPTSVCRSGLWKWSRHPNYFGEAVFWWGIWLSAVTLDAPLWTVYAPALLTVLLLRVSGVALMESTIGTRRPAYADYVRTTNAFIPGPMKKPSNS